MGAVGTLGAWGDIDAVRFRAWLQPGRALMDRSTGRDPPGTGIAPAAAAAEAGSRLPRARAAARQEPRPPRIAPLPQRNAVLNDRPPRALLAARADPARLCPVVAGPAVLDGGLLTVRTAQRDVEIRAPAALLRRVLSTFDGARTVEEGLATLKAGPLREELQSFVAFLLEQGALIDANLLTAEAARYAFQGSPFGLAAPSKLTNQICRRFLWNAEGAKQAAPDRRVSGVRSPLDRFFEQRVSTYTFADASISAARLLSLLWSVGGVVRAKHDRVGWVTPKRTLASAGGMHLVEVYVALQRRVGRHSVGVYRVRYPAQRCVALEPVSTAQGLLPRAFGNPWELRYAVGAVFLAADVSVAALRYRNRALQYLFMEAGAALHNGGLVAPALKLGYATIGGYYETVIQDLCRLDGQLVLGSAIFGAAPSADEVKSIARAPELDFAWVDSAAARYAMPFHLGRARVKTDDDSRPFAWGRATDPWVALRKASAEAIEREGFREPKAITRGTLAGVRGAIDPRQFVRYSAPQLRAKSFPYRPFDPAATYLWSRGHDLASSRAVHVLADLVYSRASLIEQRHVPGQPFTQVTSSGCAAGASFDDALLRALLEVIERDAFMRHWLMQVPGEPLALRALSADLRQRLNALAALGCRVCVQRLDSRWAHVALVAAQHDGQHFTTMGTAAHADLLSAVHAALDELEARVYAWIHGHAPTINDPRRVETTEHHFELYGRKRYFRRADAVLFPSAPGTRRLAARPASCSTAQELVGRFVDTGLRPIAVDITPRLHRVDQGRTALTVVKALVPSLLPMSFGFMREPRGMVPRVHPASRFPHPFP